MKLKLLLLALIAFVFVWNFVSYSSSEYVSRLLDITFDVPISKLEVSPGKTVEIDGSMYNSGYLWLYDVDLRLEGLPEGFEGSIEPNFIKVFPRRFYWIDSPIGIPVPKNFTVMVKVPENPEKLVYDFNITATGYFKIYIPSDMVYKPLGNVTRKQRIVLKVLPLTHFSLTDITVPEEVKEGEEFNVTALVVNDGNVYETVNLSVVLPENWSVVEKIKSISLGPGENSTVVFEVTPTNTSGNVSVLMSYPYNKTIVNVTRVGPYLKPTPLPAVLPPVRVTPILNISLPVIIGPYGINLTSVAIAVAILVVIALLYLFFTKYRIRVKRSKPEKMSSIV